MRKSFQENQVNIWPQKYFEICVFPIIDFSRSKKSLSMPISMKKSIKFHLKHYEIPQLSSFYPDLLSEEQVLSLRNVQHWALVLNFGQYICISRVVVKILLRRVQVSKGQCFFLLGILLIKVDSSYNRFYYTSMVSLWKVATHPQSNFCGWLAPTLTMPLISYSMQCLNYF